MLNNKGFAVSAVLYTLLIAFLMFLGVALAMFSASSSLIGKANDDLINGATFSATPIKSDSGCNRIIKVKSRYGIMYWPSDFVDKSKENWTFDDAINESRHIKPSLEEGSDVVTFTDNLTTETTSAYADNSLCNK